MDHTLNNDALMRVSLLDGQARALLIKSTALCEAARRIHNTSRVATAALGRLLTATALLGSELKGEGHSVTCMVKGNGPLGTLIAVGRADGGVKGYVQNPDADLPRAGDKLPVGDAVGRAGTLSVIKDLGLKEPYTGRVNLVSGELGEDFAMYFTASEQVPSLVSLGVLVKDTVVAAGGLIVQLMPGASEAAIQSVELSAKMFTNISATMREYDLHGAAQQLLSHLQPQALGESRPRYHCDCSRERAARALISLGREELTQMIEERRGCEVDCHFCNRRQKFDDGELRELLAQATRP
ncbi:Hsp33 family molecular chaperone HslO [Bacillota bacterium Meth-B3]|nr:Hsp33 family molecular chaperone HslO [Christensenellaceae bacterium]MEA5066699.1 Hsp33 family molecular chaperone HslO [Eubacteriales bacterium]